MNPATGADLEARSLRTLTPQELAVGIKMLDDAWIIITSARPWVADIVDDPTPAGIRLRALVVQITCAMVLRVLNNPDGKLQEQIDDYSWRRDSAVSTGLLYLSDAEDALIGPGGAGSDGAFTIHPAGIRFGNGYWASTDVWVPLP
jgi:hypothetical protein